MKDTVQDGGSLLTTGYHEGLRKQLAVCGCLHCCPGAYSDSGDRHRREMVKGFHSHSAVC